MSKINYPAIFRLGDDLITLFGDNRTPISKPEAVSHNRGDFYGSIDDVLEGGLQPLFTAGSPITYTKLMDGDMYRLRAGKVECSVSGGEKWMSTNTTISTFVRMLDMFGEVKSLSGQDVGTFIG